jgi:hypothetical protein
VSDQPKFVDYIITDKGKEYVTQQLTPDMNELANQLAQLLFSRLPEDKQTPGARKQAFVISKKTIEELTRRSLTDNLDKKSKGVEQEPLPAE